MKSANSLAMQELNQIREKHRAELNANLIKVRALAPEYSQIEADLRSAGNALLRSVLHGGEDFEKLKSYIQNKQKAKQTILAQLGLPPDFTDEKYDCEICHDTGFDENGLKCSCLKALTAKYIAVNSNMTELMKKQTFENFDFSLFPPVGENGKAPLDIMRAAYDKAIRFADNPNHGNILLCGNAGTGKTYLSSCIANRALDGGMTVYYQTAYKLCEMMENIKFDKISDDEERSETASAIRYAETADLLVIDDLGTEFITQFTAAALFDLLNTRLLKEKSTVISTNLSLSKIDSLYSARMTSRIFGSYTVLLLMGPDLRKRPMNVEICDRTS